MLDGPDDIRGPVVHISYLYGYVPRFQERAFADHWEYEKRQFHFDALSGMTYYSLQFTAHQRHVRKGLRAGTRQLQNCSAPDDETPFNMKVPPAN